MLTLPVKVRKDDEKPAALRKKGELLGVLYGPKIKNKSLKLDYKTFEKIYSEAGLSSLIFLDVEGEKSPVLIHDVQKDSLTSKFLHVDFYQPRLEEKIEAKIPLIFEGELRAVKDLGGTLIKNIQELEVKALPQNLPKEIIINVEDLKALGDNILIKDLKLPKEVEILREPDEIVAFISAPEKVEEELKKPIEEKVEEVEKVGEKEKGEKEVEEKEEKGEEKARK